MTGVPDAVAITNLLYRYAELIDAGDYEGIGAHLAHAVITTDGSDHETRGGRGGGDVPRDHPEVRERHAVDQARDHQPDRRRRRRRALGNLPLVLHRLAEGGDAPLRPIITGRYRDEFEKVDGEWRFSRRHMGVDQVGDLSLHLLIDLG